MTRSARARAAASRTTSPTSLTPPAARHRSPSARARARAAMFASVLDRRWTRASASSCASIPAGARLFACRPCPSASTRVAKSYRSSHCGRMTCGTPALLIPVSSGLSRMVTVPTYYAASCTESKKTLFKCIRQTVNHSRRTCATVVYRNHNIRMLKYSQGRRPNPLLNEDRITVFAMQLFV